MTALERISPTPERLKLRVEDYLLLSESGALDNYAKTELIDGEIVAVNAQYSRHARLQRDIFLALNDACRALGLEALFELSAHFDDHNMPRPDIVVARDVPENGPLLPDNILLAVEIADSSARADLRVKPRLYAAAGLPEYWVVEAKARLVHRMWGPKNGEYLRRPDPTAFGEPIAAATIEGLRVETAGL